MKELKSPLECIAAIILSCIVIPSGMIYNAGKSIYHCIKMKPIMAVMFFFIYWLTVVYQVWNVIKYLLNKIAIAIDLLGNVTSGEMIEDCVTAKESTMYGRGDITISSATGELEVNNDLNSTGKWFTKALSKILGKNHCIDAYNKVKNN